MVRSGNWWTGPVDKVRGRLVWLWNLRVRNIPVGPVTLVLLPVVLYLSLDWLGNLGRGSDDDVDATPARPSLTDSTAISDSLAAMDPGLSYVEKLLDEANRNFTHMAAPIHPFGVRELMESVTDEYPGPVAVDLAGINGGYRYPTTPVEASSGGVIARNPPQDQCLEPEEMEDDDENQDGYFIYRRLGRLPNGWHVLRVGDNGGGPSVFESLLLVRFRADREYGEGGRQRVLMERRGMIRLGDRYEGRIRIHGDSISLSADVSSGSRQEDASFGFPSTD